METSMRTAITMAVLTYILNHSQVGGPTVILAILLTLLALAQDIAYFFKK